jgi:hypothetical protein
MKSSKIPAILSIGVFLGGAAPLMGQGRFEIGFGWTMVRPALNATYVNEYTPALVPPDRYISSFASQTLKVQGRTMYGMNGFFNVFFTDSVGLQILADYHRPGLKGANSPYDLSMSFLAFEPETYHPAPPADWPNTEGNLTETTFNLQLIDEEYHLTGGTYQMVYRFGPKTKYGFNVGTEAAFEAFRRVILAVDMRWFGCPKSDFPLHIVEDEAITHPIAEIEQAIGLGSLRVNPSYFRVGLAVRFIF